MRFLVQGLLAMAILLYISVWVASIPTTEAAKADEATAALIDLTFNVQVGR